ncbi:RagB/SusD family nutrient uptake outer membrane protein [Chitinophaga sancti]|uniref:RagB/SusD domain-containing protein n=1 Tax=Chitinophaga sancti TaxID=1004 RepID=A0A1K1RMG4_9BACT|nr:RagB/SusD family nutrient uptake outer membrane protein [Chitinophaga sancti]WQD62641.1 RagB/SusD family nutrient uptake outer membrane protein [Chitinophaga sancti]WQG91736.1 RagB/SusD family nutrient uptake outer membrane protein [Chitinophaga sancti]SFW73289.1 RagB/SusD domain-containing protein [Chitinophaga sancti]
MVYVRIILLAFCLVSCRKLLTVPTTDNEQSTEAVFSSDVSADAAVADIYYTMGMYYSGNLLSVINGMTADEGGTLNGYYQRFVNNSIPADDAQISLIWSACYKVIYRCNAVLEGLSQAKGLNAEKVLQWKGEAMFMRALCYYYLVNCWGDVPYITTTDVNQTARASRNRADSIYQWMKKDLVTAMVFLPESKPGAAPVRAAKDAAMALMARVCLQNQQPAAAEFYATQVISSGRYRLCVQDSTFLYNSPQAILQIWTQDGYTLPGQLFLPGNDGTSYYPLSATMMGGFEDGDLRKTAWTRSFTYSGTTYYYPYKYKKRMPASGEDREYLVVLRIAEQYLIRAEARAQQEKFADAIADLNEIRGRAGLDALDPNGTRTSTIAAVAQERRVELFCEWGDRWHSLQRTGTMNQVLGALKPGYWQAWAAYYPIPQGELDKDPNLIQNPGY